MFLRMHYIGHCVYGFGFIGPSKHVQWSPLKIIEPTGKMFQILNNFYLIIEK